MSLNDILNHYDTKKKAQNAVKSATHGVSLKIEAEIEPNTAESRPKSGQKQLQPDTHLNSSATQNVAFKTRQKCRASNMQKIFLNCLFRIFSEQAK